VFFLLNETIYFRIKFMTNKPYFHNDPFDRLLIVQAISEDIYLMSEDRIFEQYHLAKNKQPLNKINPLT
jgi:PIN domain nuclease of toxin-antitoxin system